MHPNSYYGGKFRYAKRIADIIEKFMSGEKVYVEPFCGFCFVMKELIRRKTFEYYEASDLNESLILMLQDASRGVFVPPEIMTREIYEDLKKDKISSALRGFVGFCYSFNNIFFRGLRDAYQGNIEKTKHGNEVFMNGMSILKNVKFSFKDYEKYEEYENCFFYLDPPYKSRTEQYKYSDGSVITFDVDKFWEFARHLSKKNTVLVSEYEAPDDFDCVLEIKGLHGTEKVFKFRRSK